MDNNNPQTHQWLNQSFYQNIPHAEVNWAQLAQRWMSMRAPSPSPIHLQQQHQQQHQQHQQQQQQHHQLPFRPPVPLLSRPPIPLNTMPIQRPLLLYPPVRSLTCSIDTQFPDLNMDYHHQHPSLHAQPSVPMWNPSPARRPQPADWPSPIRPRGAGILPAPGSFTRDEPFDAYNYAGPGSDDVEEDYAYQYNSPPLADRRGDEEPLVARYPEGDIARYPEGDIDQYDQRLIDNDQDSWQSGSAMQWTTPPLWDSGAFTSDYAMLDQNARKVLPAWIREGLEKAEKEKRKKQEQDEKLRMAEEAIKERRAQKGLGKFDSSDEEEGEEDGDAIDKNGGEDTKANMDDESEELTEDGKRQLNLLRRFMTEILLETTDEDVRRICSILFTEMRETAKPKVLAKSSALAALCQLGDDEDESDDSDGGENNEESTSKESVVFKSPLPPLPALFKNDNNSGIRKSIQLSSNNLPERPGVSDISTNDNAEKCLQSDTAPSVAKELIEERTEEEKAKKKKRSRVTPEKYQSHRSDHHHHRERRRSRSREKERHHQNEKRKKKSRSPEKSARSERSRSPKHSRRRRSSRSRERR